MEGDDWETLVKPCKTCENRNRITFGEGLLKAVCTEIKDHGGRIFQF